MLGIRALYARNKRAIIPIDQLKKERATHIDAVSHSFFFWFIPRSTEKYWIHFLNKMFHISSIDMCTMYLKMPIFLFLLI